MSEEYFCTNQLKVDLGPQHAALTQYYQSAQPIWADDIIYEPVCSVRDGNNPVLYYSNDPSMCPAHGPSRQSEHTSALRI